MREDGLSCMGNIVQGSVVAASFYFDCLSWSLHITAILFKVLSFILWVYCTCQIMVFLITVNMGNC